MHGRLTIVLLAGLVVAATPPPLRLSKNSTAQLTFGGRDARAATIALRRGESAEVVVVQRGIDVVVSLKGPDGTLIDEIDSPNGRNGDEPVAIVATTDGAYRIDIRPISTSEPDGSIEVRVRALRSVAETNAIRKRQAEQRSAAADWLRSNDVALPPFDRIENTTSLAPFDQMARSARLIGLGEATHGSREFGDIRLELLQRLVTRFGYRVVAVEDSAARWRALEPFVAGTTGTPAVPVEWGWIGRRSRSQLLQWVRTWNLQHPEDRVRVVGIDPQDNPLWRNEVPQLLERAYGPALVQQWRTHELELAAADEQTQVFGDSGVAEPTRDFLQDLHSRLIHDAPLLKPRIGSADFDRLIDQVRDLAAFADFNAGNGAMMKSRDWYMAVATLRALEPGQAKGVYWAHNSHISNAATSWGPTGALLRGALGCGYRAIATTFGRGAFLAQIPNDPADRLAVSRVDAASEESLENVLAEVREGTHIASWPCGAKPDRAPWLAEARPMRWVGGLYAPGTPPSGSYRPYRLTDAFDAIVYIPRVKAEADPGDRPAIPARKR